MLLLSSADIFSKLTLKKIHSGTLSECQTVWIQIRTDILSVLIWVQTVCQGYQHMTKVTASKKGGNDALQAINERTNLFRVCNILVFDQLFF